MDSKCIIECFKNAQSLLQKFDLSLNLAVGVILYLRNQFIVIAIINRALAIIFIS